MKSQISRRQFVSCAGTGAAACLLLGAVPGRGQTPAPAGELAEMPFRPLSLGSVRPEGWLRRQLQLQAQGLTGHLDEFWPDVAQSQWFGGQAEGWERAPYWLDGLIPLAWVLGDGALQAKAKRRVDQIMAGQREDGWYSPYPGEKAAKPYDLWSILLVNKALVQYHEAIGDAKVLDGVMRNLKATAATLDRTPLFDWGRFRWFEGLIPVYYCYQRTGEKWLLDLARKLHAQGFDYQQFYAGDDITRPTARRGKWTFEKHVVNTAMALKAGALAWRLTRSESERQFPAQMLQILDRAHGQVTGMFSGDECLAGPNPVQGTELCAVAEAMYSLELLTALTGEPAFADRLERIAFNALPATFTADMWAHQYDQQVNQVQCTINPDQMWSTNGPESNLYGLEPNYGCCTANLHQAWPKFAAHLWMRTSDQGLAAIAYAPSTADCQIRDTPVRATIDTEYPFRDRLRLTVTTARSVRFPLVLRIPAWTEGATLQIGDGPPQPLKPGSFHRVERDWPERTTLDLKFPMRPRVSRRFHRAVALERGPLVYSLQMGESWTRVNADKPHRELPHGDFEVRPTTPWNYGLQLDEANPERSVTFAERPVGDAPFSSQNPPVVATVQGRRLPGWQMAHGWAADTPASPQTSNEPLEKLVMVPYGCTRIRVTEFPSLDS